MATEQALIWRMVRHDGSILHFVVYKGPPHIYAVGRSGFGWTAHHDDDSASYVAGMEAEGYWIDFGPVSVDLPRSRDASEGAVLQAFLDAGAHPV